MMGGAQLVGRWVESYTGMSTDNIKGLLLALSSSLFIGASFIVKKKGLKKAGASGVRAGEAVRALRSALALALLGTMLSFSRMRLCFRSLLACCACRLDLSALQVGSQWWCQWVRDSECN